MCGPGTSPRGSADRSRTVPRSRSRRVFRHPGADDILRRLTSPRQKALAVSNGTTRGPRSSRRMRVSCCGIHRTTRAWPCSKAIGARLSRHSSARTGAASLASLEQATLTADGGTLISTNGITRSACGVQDGRPLAVLSALGKSRWTAQFADGGILTRRIRTDDTCGDIS